MKLHKTARAILGVTALAWSIPFVQAAETAQPGVSEVQQRSARFAKLDADRNGDGRLDPTEAITAHQLYERALAARVEGVKDVKDGLAIRK